MSGFGLPQLLTEKSHTLDNSQSPVRSNKGGSDISEISFTLRSEEKTEKGGRTQVFRGL